MVVPLNWKVVLKLLKLALNNGAKGQMGQVDVDDVQFTCDFIKEIISNSCVDPKKVFM